MTTPRAMTLREVVAMAQGMVLMDEEVKLGFVASSQESARCTGFAVAQLLAVHGATWHPAFEQVRWPSGAALKFLSVRNPDRLRGFRWAVAFVSGAAASQASTEVLEQVRMSARPPGGGIFECAEVANRDELDEQLRQVA
jgi:phage terminase large subunit-like protein